MVIKLKWMVIFEAVIILILLAFIIYSYSNKNPNPEGLLSQRIYSRSIEPKSFMIITFDPLKEKIKILTQNNENVSVYVENFRDGTFMGINEKTGFFPTSLNKLPVAIIAMKKIEQGELSLDSMIKLNEEDKIDSWGELYKSEKNELPLRVVLEKMLKESDNTALIMLLHHLNLDDLQFLLDYYDIDIKVHKTNGIETKDLVTPKAMSNLFRSIYFSTVLNPENSEYLLSLLTSTTFDIKTIAKLPDNVKVAQKFGFNYYNNNQFFHDCGIIYIDESRVFYCIMTKNLNQEEATKTIGFIVNEVYNYVIDKKTEFEKMKESS